MPLQDKSTGVNDQKNISLKPKPTNKKSSQSVQKKSSSTKENQTLMTNFLKSKPSTPVTKNEDNENEPITTKEPKEPENKPVDIKEPKEPENKPVTTKEPKEPENKPVAIKESEIKPVKIDDNKELAKPITTTTSTVIDSAPIKQDEPTKPTKPTTTSTSTSTDSASAIQKDSPKQDLPSSSSKLLSPPSTIKVPVKIRKSPAKRLCNVIRDSDRNNKSIMCNLESESQEKEDNELIEKLELNEEQLKLKETDKDMFWEQVAEAVRVELNENLEDNKELVDMKEEMEAESKDLAKQQEKLMKLADEAGDICREFMDLNTDEVDDSGILD